MKRTEAKTIGDIVNNFLKQENLDTQLDEYRAAALWPHIVGDGINRYTISRDVRNGVMHVRLSSASLRAELTMLRSALVTRINEAMGHEVIKDIIFN